MRGSRVLVGAGVAWVIGSVGCDSGRNRVAERVSCYPACLADIVQLCPMLGACETTTGTNTQVSNADVQDGVAACFASGEKKWEATNATSGDRYIVVKHATGVECYTAISQGASMRYTISFGGQTIAELDADAQPPTITCGGTTTTLAANPDCFTLPWTPAMTCGEGPCDFGALPSGAATDATPN